MNKKQKKMLWRIIVSAVLMVALHFVPVTGLVRFALYMVPYFIVGYDILWKAVLGIWNRQVFDENFLMAVATGGAIVIGLAAVIIGEVLLRNHGKVLTGLIGCSVGAIVYYFVIQIVLRLGLGTNDLKLFTALIVALFLAVPYWKGKAAAARKRSVNLKEEKNNARA